MQTTSDLDELSESPTHTQNVNALQVGAGSADEDSPNEDYSDDSEESVTGTVRGTTTSTSSLRVITFEEELGRPAGEHLVQYQHLNPYLRKSPKFNSRESDPKSLYYPFISEHDFALASWFTKSKTTKGRMDEFLRDPRLRAMNGSCSFRGADDWRVRMHEIPWGIKNDQWQATKIRIDSKIADMKSTEHIIYHRDIIETIRFLLGHGPFKDNLTYAPERHYLADGARVYNEMHTGDWWWSQQTQLPDGATVVPLLLATDKTMLTQHHGDLALWPVYLTIGNLDIKTRKSQIRPSMVLVGLIPVVKVGKEHGPDLKSEVYHKAMGHILQRESPNRHDYYLPDCWFDLRTRTNVQIGVCNVLR